MRLGIVTYQIGNKWDVDTIISKLSAAQFEGVELRTTHAHGVETSLSDLERAEIAAKFDNSPVEIAGLGSAFDYHSPDPDELRRNIEGTKEYVVLAHDVDAPGVKVRPNGLPKEVPVEKTLEQIGLAVRECAEFALNYGVEIRVEVHGGGTSLPHNMASIMEHADHPNAYVCWNSNASDLIDGSIDEAWKLLGERIGLVHITELYNENYPYKDLFRYLKGSGYTGFCLAEIPESAEPDRLLRYYRALFQALQP